jgi:hypothetical protein
MDPLRCRACEGASFAIGVTVDFSGVPRPEPLTLTAKLVVVFVTTEVALQSSEWGQVFLLLDHSK